MPHTPDSKQETTRVGSLLRAVGFIAIGLIAGLVISHQSHKSASPAVEPGAIALKPGPWGNIEYVPIEIAPPDELLPVRFWESQELGWTFEKYTRDQLEQLLVSLDVPPALRKEMLDDQHLKTVSDKLVMNPSPETVFALSPAARLGIYKVLAGCGLNDSSRMIIKLDDVEAQSQKWGVSKESLELFKSVSVPYKKYLVCYAFPFVLARTADFEQKQKLFKAVCRQKTMLVRLHVTTDSDIAALNSYWGRAVWTTDVRAIFDSLSHIPDGFWLNLVAFLPPLPSSLLYTYPVPQNPMAGPVVRQDCHWTSLNFFRNPPDNQLEDSVYVTQKLATDYYPIASDPRYGDIALFLTSDGRVIHSAVFIADNIAFTHNGAGFCNPWMLSTIEELTDLYSFTLPDDQKVDVRFYRNKSY
jgi:hypothetical protein